MRYVGDFFVFDDSTVESHLYHEVESGIELLGYASFDEEFHWEYEHSVFVVLHPDLVEPFKDGDFVWDSHREQVVGISDTEPSLGSHYIGVGNDVSVDDEFEIDDENVCLVLIAQ